MTAFQELLEQHGLTEERLIQTHVESLHAMKVVATATENGKVTDIVERPDYRARQAAVRDGYRLWDRLEKHNQEEPPAPHPIITLSVERAKWVAKVANRPLEDFVGKIEIVDPEDENTSDERKALPAASPELELLTPSADGAPPSTADDVEWEDDDDIAIDL